MTDQPARRVHFGTEADAAEIMRSPQIPLGNVRWLYHSGYYDGPISGRVSVAGESLWVQRFEECDCYDDEGERDCGFYRRYRLIRLTPEADADEARRHALFREMVGTHTEYGEDGRRKSQFDASTHPDWHSFYEIAKTWPEWVADGALVGWFER